MKDLDWLGVRFKPRVRGKRKRAPKKFRAKESWRVYVGSNIEKMWWGNEAMTPNLNKNKDG